jgi:hypothetical protein
VCSCHRHLDIVSKNNMGGAFFERGILSVLPRLILNTQAQRSPCLSLPGNWENIHVPLSPTYIYMYTPKPWAGGVIPPPAEAVTQGREPPSTRAQSESRDVPTSLCELGWWEVEGPPCPVPPPPGVSFVLIMVFLFPQL